MRIFVGVFLPKNIVEHLNSHLNQVKSLTGVRWVPTDSWHVTLKFVGEIEEDKLPNLHSLLGRVVPSHRPMSLMCQGGGVFPNQKHPRVFCTRIGGDQDNLKQLAHNIEEEFGALGFPSENRKFSPHVTVGRSQEEPEKTLMTAAGQFCTLFCDYKSPDFFINEVHLVRSHIKADGPHYEVLNSFSLRQN